MVGNLKKYSFNDLLKQGKVRIPKIQRDYAQGRVNRKVNEIRKVFIHTLILVAKGKMDATELDFVYGSNQDNAFEPLDGQQRLTTLFLLHWMMGVDLRQQDANQNMYSMFTYETRNTSNEFCNELIQHEAIKFVKQAFENIKYNRTKNAKEAPKPDTPSLIIKSLDWFRWGWKYDPTILSMLVMIDAIFAEIGEESEWENAGEYQKNLNNITFNLLNLGDFGLSNELFIKMNARGKHLSDFDKLKSTLEEELQIQKREHSTDDKIEEEWRKLMDGVWIDLFWHKYARETIKNISNKTDDNPAQSKNRVEVLKAAQCAEEKLKLLLLRLIALQLFESDLISSNSALENATYNLNESNIDSLLFAYTDSLTSIRSLENYTIDASTTLKIDYRRLIDDLNLLIFNDGNNRYCEISSLLSRISHIENNDDSLFDSFLKDIVPNDVRLIFYAMILFLRKFPARKGDDNWVFDKEKNGAWKKNLEDWVRTTRNILLNDNNTQRIDKLNIAKNVTKSLNTMVTELGEFTKRNNCEIYEDAKAVKLFIKSMYNFPHMDNSSQEEERKKAECILSNNGEEWNLAFDEAEKHPYLWGQIRCLLSWADYKLDDFKKYYEKLSGLLDIIRDEKLCNEYYSAMLAMKPTFWTTNHRMYLFNRDRDNSFKRYLRDSGKDIKDMIDKWQEAYPGSDAITFLGELKTEVGKASTIPCWIRCIVDDPKIMNESLQKRIFEDKGHPILAQLKTKESHCFDPVFVYLRNKCIDKNIDETKYKMYDSKGDCNYGHGFQIETNNVIHFVQWNSNGGYKLSVNNQNNELTADGTVDYFNGLIDNLN